MADIVREVCVYNDLKWKWEILQQFDRLHATLVPTDYSSIRYATCNLRGGVAMENQSLGKRIEKKSRCAARCTG